MPPGIAVRRLASRDADNDAFPEQRHQRRVDALNEFLFSHRVPVMCKDVRGLDMQEHDVMVIQCRKDCGCLLRQTGVRQCGKLRLAF